jgi:hypothetical protein
MSTTKRTTQAIYKASSSASISPHRRTFTVSTKKQIETKDSVLLFSKISLFLNYVGETLFSS